MTKAAPLNFLATALATCGVGFAPKAPGTVGSALAALIWWFFSSWISLWVVIATFLVGWLATHFYETWNGKHDPKEVVIDEVVGLWIVLLISPLEIVSVLAAFLLFRLFDIWKPFPIGWVDKKVPGAFGTMIDDVLAGLFALVCFFLILPFLTKSDVAIKELYGILV